MDRGLILYLHGFCSSPASWKSRLLAEEMARRGLAGHFTCPQLSPVPDEAVAGASRLIEAAGGRVTLVGSSLGGHYANHLAEKYDLKAVLINPAVVDRLDLADFVGDHANFHSGERFTFSAAHAAQLKAQVARPTPERYWLLLEEGDEVLDFRQARDFYAGCRQTVLAGGDHSFTKFPDFVPQLIEFAGL
ncbi:YqiA/YcfP family alpha/beta fold hydrolase [Dechloromonas sp. A34]|uniref:YqiA/YcfP family alpha/beta fold hydrolase n=1 Tax=Dechloromonas sp. A34 TaxID=447588 RepID=UPI002248EB05|nr:YqiA/YcfP family alpha/beta fold hydrolase [Dechloromonas sp. A34]